MSEEEFINNVEGHITSLKNLDNKALKILVAKLEEENKKLKEKVETLELWLDNKEKLNEEYRDKIDLLKYQSYGPSELADSLYDANKTIEKLKEELKELKEYSVKLTGMAVTYNSVKEREEKQKEQIEKCKLVLLGINEKLIEEIFGED